MISSDSDPKKDGKITDNSEYSPGTNRGLNK